MRQVLENEYLKVSVEDHGAELVSVYVRKMREKSCGRQIPPIGTVMRLFSFRM